jgi:hypothetical protein
MKTWGAISLLILTVACGCSSKKVMTSTGPRIQLFPPGVYQHDVALTIKSNSADNEKKYHLSGVVKLSKDEVMVVVLSSFGLTELKIHENLKTNALDFEISRPGMKKFEPQMKEYYKVLKTVLLEPASSSEHTETQDGATFEFLNYDKNKVPGLIKIENPHFKVEITVTAYEA